MFEWLFGKKDVVTIQPHPIEVRNVTDKDKNRNLERIGRLRLALERASGEYKDQIKAELKIRENV